MPQKQLFKGNCTYCGAEVTKSAVNRHLTSCPDRRKVLEAAGNRKSETETYHHLHVEDAYNKEFWLELEMRGSATLNQLDSYLRHIWLECCDHLSEFRHGKAWRGPVVGMSRRAESVFEKGVALTHIYDFGTSSETLIKAVSVRDGRPTTKHPIALMARNQMPACECRECGKPATHLCMECLIENDERATLCDKHARTHPHDEYGAPLPLVNSPRLGMCGYDGPADPPY